MNLKRTRVHILHEKTDLSRKAKTGVSLHCHTEYSKELMDFVPIYTEKIPVVSYLWKKERDKYEARVGRKVNFTTAYWSPPMPPQEVFSIEKNQINEAGLNAVISITDHDCIEGNLKVNEETDNKIAPISLEWTVPFEYGFFHVGVHNLPKENALEISKILIDYSFEENPQKERLHELFALLSDLPEVLVILNHPLWDIEMIGKEPHRVLLDRFLKEFGQWIHAFEVNGFRKWSENKQIMEMAESMGFPVVTGGDRHGCKPNTVINLTDAETFAEFAEEIRVDKRSQVVFMPDYRQPLLSRQLNSFSEILATYNHFPQHRQQWHDRVFYDTGDGQGLVSLATHWKESGYRRWLRVTISILGFFGSPVVRPLFSLTRNKKDRVPVLISEQESDDTQFDEVTSKHLTSDGAL